MDECVALTPLSVCGGFGTCVNQTLCACNSGWSQSVEYAFFVNFEDDTFDKDSLPCDTNNVILRLLYAAVAVLALLVIYVNFIIITRLSQFRRLMFFFLGLISYAVLGMYRAINIEAVFREDKLFSTLLITGFFLVNVNTVIFVNKYLWYQEKVLPVHHDKNKYLIALFARAEKLTLVICFMAFLMNLLATFLSDFEAAKICYSIGTVFYALISLFAMFPGVYLISLLIFDVDKMSEAYTDVNLGLDLRLVLFYMRINRNLTFILHSIIMTSCILFLVTDFGKTLIKYAFPFCTVLGEIHGYIVYKSFEIARLNRKKMLKDPDHYTKNQSGTIFFRENSQHDSR